MEAVKFIVKRLGEDGSRDLEIRANTVGEKIDFELIKIDLENKLKEVMK
jgi:hypothetical protein